MNIDFKDIGYLKTGNPRQKKVHGIITKYNILEILHKFNPIIVGTIPIGIDVEDSDVDIILQTNDIVLLEEVFFQHFSNYENYQIKIIEKDKLVCNFYLEDLPFEFYASNIDSDMQNGYLHMLKEHEIIQAEGENFVEQIKALKRSGIKTEPAFCELLEIKGDPYVEILKYKIK